MTQWVPFQLREMSMKEHCGYNFGCTHPEGSQGFLDQVDVMIVELECTGKFTRGVLGRSVSLWKTSGLLLQFECSQELAQV